MTDVLVVGGGAREHAICWTLRKSASLGTLLCAPGNAGTAQIARNLPIGGEQIDDLVAAAERRQVDLVVVGPEAPLAGGLVDRLAERGIRAFGPTAAAARVEASKAWTKELLLRLGVPTASATAVHSLAAARSAIARIGLPLVIKADGLAAGKGVWIVATGAEAEHALEELFSRRSLGAAGDVALIEELLVGRELSVLAFCDGERMALMPPARDYKRAFDGDRGPNTGGMGAYSRPADATAALVDQARRRIIEPVVASMAAAGSPFRGVLYAGLMLTDHGPKVLEFNCRFGDPEAQVMLPLARFDVLEAMLATSAGRLGEVPIAWSTDYACGVVLAAGGYPGPYDAGLPLGGLDEAGRRGLVFHAGTEVADCQTLSTGGRVLTAVGVGATLASARSQAYAAVEAIDLPGGFHRTDIAAVDGLLP